MSAALDTRVFDALTSFAYEDADRITRAIALAIDAHHGQTDRGGRPYVWHPISVAGMVLGDIGRGSHDADIVIAALLHDVVEDTPVTITDVLIDFKASVAGMVRTLTRPAGMPYPDYIVRIMGDPGAHIVKVRDLQHNLDPSRAFDGEDSLRLRERYTRALSMLRMESAG